MKKISKVILLVLSLTLVLAFSVTPAFAAGTATDVSAEDATESVTEAPAESATGEKESEIVKNDIDYTYEDKDKNIILVFKDGRQYNLTEQEWILGEFEPIKIQFNMDNLGESLQYMWQGMLCIFVVIGVIILAVYLLNFCSERAVVMKQIKDEEKEDNK